MVNIEAFSYSVLTSIMGMIVVFAFLTFLSLMMVVIKRIFDRPAGQPAAGQAENKEKNSTAENNKSGESTDWIIAAVSAFIEDEDQPRSAMSWLPPVNEKTDPWVSSPRITPGI